MPFDTQTRNRLARLVTDARELITSEFAQQLQSVHGISKSGVITPLSELNDLNEEQRELAEVLRGRLEYLQSSSAEEEDPAVAVDRFTREQAFTVLNRLAALRMAEKRGYILESVGRGYQSKGFQVFSQVAGSGLGDTYHRYRQYLFCLFDELAADLGALFDRRSPAGFLFPRETALLAIFDLINAPEIDPLWNEDETIGWIYQYYNDEAERKRMREKSDAPRNSRELAVRNQFFTPRYIVEFLVDNTLGRDWYEARKGNTKLKEVCRYLTRHRAECFLQKGESAPASGSSSESASDEEFISQPFYVPHRPRKDPRDLKILDPACGSGHFLLYSYDLLEIIYEEAWSDEQQVLSEATGKSIRGDYPDLNELRKSIPELITRHNLHGIDIDLRACQITALAIWLRVQRTYQLRNLEPAKRPNIARTNIVCAEPMPGDREQLVQFVADLRPNLLGQLVQVVFEKMQLAGEAGALLKIEDEIAGAVAEAKRLWQSVPKIEQGRLFADDRRPQETQLAFDLSGITDEMFWHRAERQIYAALEAYAERAEDGHGYGRRLFSRDTARGFAFIDLCRQKYDVVLMNPPFGDASIPSKPYLDETYGDTRGDVYKAFVECFHARLVFSGRLGIISSRTGFFLSQSEDWRTRVVLRLFRPITLVDLGSGVLDAMVEVSAYVLRSLSEQESSNLTLSLVSALKGVALDQKERFTVPRWQATRGELKRHQAEGEIKRLEAAGFVHLCEGEVLRYKPIWDAVNQAGKAPDTVFPPFLCIQALTDANKEEVIRAAVQDSHSPFLFVCDVGRFAQIPGGPFAYWASPRQVAAFKTLPALKDAGFEAWVGLQTNEDFRWLRAWWEVENDVALGTDAQHEEQRWVPFAKGGEYSPIYCDIPLVVFWEHDGKLIKRWKKEQFRQGLITENNSQCWNESRYRRMGITWPSRSNRLSFRVLPAGCIFGHKGPALFSETDDREELLRLLGVLNSRAFAQILRLMVARLTLAQSFEVGIVRSVPLPHFTDNDKQNLLLKVKQNFELRRTVDTTRETSHYFFRPSILAVDGETLADRARAWAARLNSARDLMASQQAEIDAIVTRSYGFESDVILSAEVPVGSERESQDSVDEDVVSTDSRAITADLLSFALGVAFGRWKRQTLTYLMSVPELADPFASLRSWSPAMIESQDRSVMCESKINQSPGILVDDPENNKDIVRLVREVLNAIWQDAAEDTELEACAILGVKDLREYFRRSSLFFADHLSRYSKSRRQAPIYWPLSTRSSSYTLWLYYPRLTAQTLHQCIADFLQPKLKGVSAEIQMLRSSNGSQSRLGALTELQDELNDMHVEIERIIKLPYVPNLDDGALITGSPLWKLFRLSRWQKELKRCWEHLDCGEYDWSHQALSIWPNRVREKCKDDWSLAIAHDLESLCTVEPKPKAKKSRPKQASLVSKDAE